MSYSINMHGNTITNVLSNMRKYLSNGELFCAHLLRDFPVALTMLDNQVSEVERQIEGIRKQTKRRTAELIDLKKFHAVRQFQESQAEKLEPLNNRITELNKVKKEINDGVKADKKRKQERVKQEAARKLEQKKDRYREEVAAFNAYKLPVNLISACHNLFTSLHGATLESKCQLLITAADRHAMLVELRAELETAGATKDLYPLPALSKELVLEAEKTEFRIKGILGHSPRKKAPQMFTSSASGYEENLELQEKQNQAARKQLIEDGVIEK